MDFFSNISLPAFRIWDVLDILIVAYLFYLIYKLLKGKIAFNIFIGVMAIFGIWKLTQLLDMKLTSTLFGQFASVGIILLVIVFQPEIRRFLLVLGNTTLRQRYHFFDRWFQSAEQHPNEQQQNIRSIKSGILNLSKDKIGALIVISNQIPLDNIIATGVKLDAIISHQLIESIFRKNSPLHDGAVIISNGKIKAASCVLPLSENRSIPKSTGLRHLAAVGTTEQNHVIVFVISEENGQISYSTNGELQQNISENKITELLQENFS